MSAKSPYKKSGMFQGADPLLFELAKNLRRHMTGTEIILWQHLKSGINGLKFRRQHPIGIYIADFYCHKVRLIIEVDGLIHEKLEIKSFDEEREKQLKDLGCQILRFTNKEIYTDIENVLEKIKASCQYIPKLNY
jgi:cyclase